MKKETDSAINALIGLNIRYVKVSFVSGCNLAPGGGIDTEEITHEEVIALVFAIFLAHGVMGS